MNKGEYTFKKILAEAEKIDAINEAKVNNESVFWPKNDPENLTVDSEHPIHISTTNTTMEEKIDLATKMEPKPLSEVEKAQASVKEWQAKVDLYKKELHFAEKNLKVHQWALKKLQEIEK